ncbi:MAG: ATP-binding protein [Betaproteobacteria bacterium AqS2]|uniref:ATP-binding protein n=1 Tax=Candidatus Amphirhobacter heronislandensis TaxID=1732024 RepID=A0A930UBC9_9GAMM|nr:ATP-binding protein [Betaproteobacteria bacterium AqS2]
MATQHVARRHKEEVLRRLKQVPAVALLGQPQTGKTAIGRAIAAEANGIYLDCQDWETGKMLAGGGLREFAVRNAGKLIVLDEFHQQMGLLEDLSGAIDEHRREGTGNGCFLLLGYGSIRDANRADASLEGRVSCVQLNPLDVLDLSGAGEEEVEMLWLRGGLPASFAAADDASSFEIRSDLNRNILSDEIIEEGMRVGYTQLRKLSVLLAHSQGRPLNVMEICRIMTLNPRTVRKFVDGHRKRLLARALPAYYRHAKKRLKNTPKFYYRDSGLLHELLGVKTAAALKAHEMAAMSWEGFVIENILCQLPEEAAARASYYGAAGGAEVDLVIERPGIGLWAIEIKKSVKRAPSRGFHSACRDLEPARRFVVHGGSLGCYKDRNGVEHMSLPDMCREAAAAFAP